MEKEYNITSKTGDIKLWPPPTNGMTLEELIKLKRIANETIEHVEKVIVVECAKEGHVWNNPNGNFGTEKRYAPRGFSGICDDDPEDPPDFRFYTRKCKRCGTVQKREEEVTRGSPF